MCDCKVFLDAKGRAIKINCDGDVYAFDGENVIGKIEIDDSDGSPILYSMEVKPEYQKAGIGTHMMMLVSDIYGKKIRKPKFSAVGGSNARSETYYTQEGKALIACCIKKGILDDTEYPENDDENYL
jgi:GNAT superfamily N-acetyltransferase